MKQIQCETYISIPAFSFSSITQITEGMIYLEDKIVHRDLRADNILLTNMQSCKIADFGLAQFVLTGNRRLSSGEIFDLALNTNSKKDKEM